MSKLLGLVRVPKWKSPWGTTATSTSSWIWDWDAAWVFMTWHPWTRRSSKMWSLGAMAAMAKRGGFLDGPAGCNISAAMELRLRFQQHQKCFFSPMSNSFIMFHHVYRILFIIIIKPCFFSSMFQVSSHFIHFFFHDFTDGFTDGLVSASRPLPLEGTVSAAPQLKGPADRELWCSGEWLEENGVSKIYYLWLLWWYYVIIKWYCSTYL